MDGKYRELKHEPVASLDRVKELEAELQEKSGIASRERAHACGYRRRTGDCKKSSAHLQQTKELRFQFVEDHRSEFSLEKMCRTFQVSRSGYYKWRIDRTSKRQNRKDEVMKRIRYHFYDHQMRCGSRKSRICSI